MAELEGLEFLRENEIKEKTCDLKKSFAFISYAHDLDDTEIVRNVFNGLYNLGYNLWIDSANIPKDENSWKDAAQDALMNDDNTCKVALFFRSEESLIRKPVFDELEMIKELEAIHRIITIDIWHEAESAEAYGWKLIREKRKEDLKIYKKICEKVDVDNSAFRIKDVGNSLQILISKLAEELEKDGVFPDHDKEKMPSEPLKCKSEEPEKMLEPEQALPPEPDSLKAKRSSGSYYTFECDGKHYEDMKLKEMMLTVFKTVMYRHTDKLDQFLDAVSCLGENIKLGKDTKPSIFRAGEVIQINGRSIAIGTSLAEPAVLKYIDKLIRTAGEPAEIFRLDSKKAKS